MRLTLWQWSFTSECFRSVGDTLHNPVLFDYSNLRLKKYARWVVIESNWMINGSSQSLAFFLEDGINPNQGNYQDKIIKLSPDYLQSVRDEMIPSPQLPTIVLSLAEQLKNLSEGEDWIPIECSASQFMIYKRIYKNLQRREEGRQSYIRKFNESST